MNIASIPTTESNFVLAESSSTTTSLNNQVQDDKPQPKVRKPRQRKTISKVPPVKQEPTKCKEKPGKTQINYDEYIRLCDDKIAQFSEDIAQVESLAKLGDDRANKEAIRRIKFSDE